jgi:hypothetical protein
MSLASADLRGSMARPAKVLAIELAGMTLRTPPLFNPHIAAELDSSHGMR